MEFMASLIAVTDMEKAKRFYVELMEQPVQMDLGENVVVGKGLALQTVNTWSDFIGLPQDEIGFGGKSSELVFEVEDLDAFVEKLKAWPSVEWLHPVREYPWGQRVLRLYDPDSHVVEVGESMKTVIKRYLLNGCSVEEAMQKSMYPEEYVKMCKRELEQEGKL